MNRRRDSTSTLYDGRKRLLSGRTRRTARSRGWLLRLWYLLNHSGDRRAHDTKRRGVAHAGSIRAGRKLHRLHWQSAIVVRLCRLREREHRLSRRLLLGWLFDLGRLFDRHGRRPRHESLRTRLVEGRCSR